MGGANFVTIGAVPDAGNDGVNAAAINFSGLSGTVIAGVTGKRIFVHGMYVQTAGAAAVQLQDIGASSTVNLTGPLTFATGVPVVLPWQNYPWFTCAPGDALIFTGSGATVQVSGRIMYVQG